MSISSIYSQTVDPLLTPGSSQQSGSTSTSGSSSASASFSSFGQMLSQLQQLSMSNPSQFQTVTASIASQLQTAAQQQGGAAGAFLNKLAGQFQTASQTGSASSLIPTGPSGTQQSGGHHHHHHGGGGQSSSATSTAANQYSAMSSQSPFSQASGIIQSALGSIGSTSSAV